MAEFGADKFDIVIPPSSILAEPPVALVDKIVDRKGTRTVAAGIALTALYAPTGPLGALAASFGVKTAYTLVGIFLALLFIGLPFVVRQLQPVLQDLDQEVDEAAQTLGASDAQRLFRVILPALTPALLGGAGLAFARAFGEYGSVIFIAGNLPMKTEIAPLLIVIKLEQYDYAGAAAIGLAMVAIALGCLVVLSGIQALFAARGRA